jgi:hypothetical protein
MSLTRRHILNRAYIVTAAAAAVTLPAACTLVSEDDELIRLGAEFDRLHAQYLPLNRLALERGCVFRDRIVAIGDNQRRALSIEEIGQIQDECGLTAPNRQAHEIADRLDALTKAIRALPATTPQGFYAKVRAASFDCGFSHAFADQSPAEMEYDIGCFFQLLEDAKRFAETTAEKRVLA